MLRTKLTLGVPLYAVGQGEQRKDTAAPFASSVLYHFFLFPKQEGKHRWFGTILFIRNLEKMGL